MLNPFLRLKSKFYKKKQLIEPQTEASGLSNHDEESLEEKGEREYARLMSTDSMFSTRPNLQLFNRNNQVC